MEINWKMLKAGLLFGAIMGLLQFLNAITAFQTPPDWWTMFRLAIVPALGILLTTILQYCPKGPQKVDNVVKCFVVALMCTFLLAGCSSINPAITKFDIANYEANKQLAKDQLKTWSFNSGFIMGLGLTNKVAFPIASAGDLRAVINSPAVVMAIVDLDEVCKKLGYWKDEDFDLGFSLGAKVRGGSQAAIEFIKDFFPDLMKYAPGVFGIL